MSTEEARAEMKRAVRYRDGPGLMNTVYLGGMGCAGVMGRLGAKYGSDSMQDAIDKASEQQIQSVVDYEGYQWILGHYRAGGCKLYAYDIVRKEIE